MKGDKPMRTLIHKIRIAIMQYKCCRPHNHNCDKCPYGCNNHDWWGCDKNIY